MKNIVATFLGILIVIFISTFFITVSSDDLEVVSEVSNPKIIQIGAFEEVESATYMANTIGGRIVQDDKFYYVYIGILSNTKNLERLINYMNNNNIYYYLKDGNFNEKFLSELYKYEDLMNNTSSDIAFLELNKKIVDLYLELNV